MNQKITKIAGPPGTGKTTYLLNTVLEFMERGIDPKNILFCSYTRAAAYEARDRAIQKFNLTEEDFPYFRTIHSLCYRALPSSEVLSPADWSSISRIIGVPFSGGSGGLRRNRDTKGDYMLSIIDAAMSHNITIEKAWMLSAENMRASLSEIEHLHRTIKRYKEDSGKIDFTDMLANYVNQGNPLPVQVAIIDEFQDLSDLQVQVVHVMSRNAEEVIVAGDDDQTVHEWAGADSQLFIDFPGTLKVLEQSYRIPSSVHEVAENIISRISNRIPKSYNPRDEIGEVIFNQYIWDIPFNPNESWLVLVRNQAFANICAETLLEKGVSFTTNLCETVTPGLLEAAITWQRLQEGQWVPAQEAKNLYDHLLARSRVKHGFKKAMQKASEEEVFDINRLIDEFGLMQNLPWDQMFRMTSTDEAYLANLQKHNALGRPPNVELCTIHHSKGREADNVVLLPDMTTKTHTSFREIPDREHRVWYVGVTRARKKLYITEPITSYFYEF